MKSAVSTTVKTLAPTNSAVVPPRDAERNRKLVRLLPIPIEPILTILPKSRFGGSTETLIRNNFNPWPKSLASIRLQSYVFYTSFGMDF